MRASVPAWRVRPTDPTPCNRGARRRREDARAKRGRDGGDSESEDEDMGGDDGAAEGAQRAQREDADGAAPMDADEPISEAEEEEGAAPAGGALGAHSVEAIKRAVEEVGGPPAPCFFFAASFGAAWLPCCAVAMAA